MRIIRGAAGKVIFKLRLPRVGGEENIRFNSLYSSLAAAYLEAAEEMANAATASVRFTVSFSVGGEDKRRLRRRQKGKGKGGKIPLPIVIIHRKAVVGCGENERAFAASDIYDPNVDVFIK